VVVGAGLAGLVAAHELKKAGVRAEVFEANRRTGGRVFSARGLMAPGVVTDLGGEFVDSGHRSMHRLVRELGLGLVDTAADPDPTLAPETYFFDGVHRTKAEAVAAFRPYVDAVARDIRQVGDPEDLPRGPRARALDALSVAEYLDALGLKACWFRTMLDVAFAAEYGLDPGELSALNLLFLLETDLDDDEFHAYGDSDERYKIGGGAQAVADALTERLADRLSFGRRLVGLRDRPGGGYTLVFSGPGSASREVSADFVVLAVPFSVLRGVELRAELPPEKRRVIADLRYGTNAKLVAGFRGRPWRGAGYRGAVFSDEPFQSAWDGSRLQNDPAGPGALTVFLGGRGGAALGAGTASEQLARLYPGLERAYPGLRADHDGRTERFHWPTAPLALGSYACYTVGQWTTLAGLEGRPVGNLLFAGEHCQPGNSGYMDSAVASGRRVARALLARLATG
jgi:monoamine oxidase